MAITGAPLTGQLVLVARLTALSGGGDRLGRRICIPRGIVGISWLGVFKPAVQFGMEAPVPSWLLSSPCGGFGAMPILQQGQDDLELVGVHLRGEAQVSELFQISH